MRIDEYVFFDEMRLMENLKNRSRMEQDQIIFDYFRHIFCKLLDTRYFLCYDYKKDNKIIGE